MWLWMQPRILICSFAKILWDGQFRHKHGVKDRFSTAAKLFIFSTKNLENTYISFISILWTTQILAILLEIFNQTFQELVIAHSLCVTYETALSPCSSDSNIYTSSITQKPHLNYYKLHVILFITHYTNLSQLLNGRKWIPLSLSLIWPLK